jgi:hypothetical protein
MISCVDFSAAHQVDCVSESASTPHTASPEFGESRDGVIGIVWRQAGATVIVPSGAPDPEFHRPAVSEGEIEAHFERKTRTREEGIARFIASARASGMHRALECERVVAAIAYDTEHAPWSTNRRQLEEIGVAMPLPGALPTAEAEISDCLWRAIYGLGRLGIFLSGTNHLDDRRLLERLCTQILEEEIRDVPPSKDMSEFIDLGFEPSHGGLCATGGALPDGLEGPFEFLPGDSDDDESYTRERFGPAVVERDAILPRPAFGDGFNCGKQGPHAPP